MAMRAVLFDIDGTLVDSNYLHIDAWSRAFEDVGHPVDAWQIHRSIGMDGNKLLDNLLSGADTGARERASELHDKNYQSSFNRLRPFEGARDLLRELSAHGLIVVLATSAPESELEALRSTLQVEDTVEIVTSSEDVSTAKPCPDVVQVALERTDVRPDEAIMVGDSVWDVLAAANAGVSCIGLLSGGLSNDELRFAGAVAVYSDVADLLQNLANSPLGRSPVAKSAG